MGVARFIRLHSGLFHDIGDALTLLKSATPLIGSDGAKINAVIDKVHKVADEVGGTVEAVSEAEGTHVDPNTVKDAIGAILPGLIAEGVSVALAKLLPDHTAAVVAAAKAEVTSPAPAV